MTLELSIILIIIVIIIYIIAIKIYSVLLQITGLPENIANYQGISLFTNCGYTTSESETITNNKFRRRISLACMITGNFFSVIIVSLIVSMISSFSLEHEKQTYIVCLIIVGVFLSLIIFTQLKPIKNLTSKLIQGFVKHFINVASKDNVITIVENFGSYSIVEIYIHKLPNFLKNKTIHESKIKVTHDINILSIKRNKRQIEITRNTLVQENDVILVYGQYNKIKELFSNVHHKEEYTEEKNERFNEIDLIDNYSSQAMVEVKINEVPLVLSEKTLFNSGIKERFGINIIFIKRNEEIIEVDKDTIILKGDKIVLFGPYLAIKNVFLY